MFDFLLLNQQQFLYTHDNEWTMQKEKYGGRNTRYLKKAKEKKQGLLQGEVKKKKSTKIDTFTD